MSITYGDHLIDSGYHDITPEQEREIEAREECARRGIDPDDYAADGVSVWQVVDQERSNGLRISDGVNRLVAAGYLREDAEDMAIEQMQDLQNAVCCSSISPCGYQRKHPTGVCDACLKAHAHPGNGQCPKCGG